METSKYKLCSAKIQELWQFQSEDRGGQKKNIDDSKDILAENYTRGRRQELLFWKREWTGNIVECIPLGFLHWEKWKYSLQKTESYNVGCQTLYLINVTTYINSNFLKFVCMSHIEVFLNVLFTCIE